MGGENLLVNLNSIAVTLKDWNVSNFGNIFKKKRKLLGRLSGIQNALARGAHTRLLKLETKLQELDEVPKWEELYWFQQSREDWITSGNLNTTFYHASLVMKRGRNRIFMLQDNEGNWVQDPDSLKLMVHNFYSNLFSADWECNLSLALHGCFPLPCWTTSDLIHASFSKEEVKVAVFAMAPYKATGPDGFHTGFFQRCWDVVGDAVCKLFFDFFRTGSIPGSINEILLALILKVSNPVSVTQFLPISLCNVIFKILTKTTTNRLKCLMYKVVSPHQSSFVPGRQISDNIIIFQEVLHSLRTRKRKEGA